MVPDLVWRRYGLRVTNVSEMNSYDDRNFKVDVAHDVINSKHISSLWPHGFNLKILNRKESLKKRTGSFTFLSLFLDECKRYVYVAF